MRILLNAGRTALLLAWAAPLPLGAQPAADAAEQLARDGITAALPAGYPAPELMAPADPAFRIYGSRSGDKAILISVIAFPQTGGAEDLEERRSLMERLVASTHRRAVQAPQVTAHDDSTHLVSSVRGVQPPEDTRFVTRVYVPRTGVLQGVVVTALNRRDDPAGDTAVLAFLEAARPRSDHQFSLLPVTLRGPGMEMVLPAGFSRPRYTPDPGDGSHGYISWNQSLRVAVFVFENRERNAAAWPPERRIRHMGNTAAPFLDVARGRADAREQIRGDLAFRDFQFTRFGDHARVTGRGRMYAPLSGPGMVVLAFYFDTRGEPLADEAAITAMFDSVRILPREEAAPRSRPQGTLTRPVPGTRPWSAGVHHVVAADPPVVGQAEVLLRWRTGAGAGWP